MNAPALLSKDPFGRPLYECATDPTSINNSININTEKQYMSDKSISNSGAFRDTDHETGHKNPPVDTRFKPGISGNPKGRPKRKDNELIRSPRLYIAKEKPEKICSEPPQPALRELTQQYNIEDFICLPLSELRQKWEQAWGIKPHNRVGRKMLEKSLVFKLRELNGQGLTRLQQERLDHLVKMYKRNPKCFDDRIGIKAGTRLVRKWKGEHVSVTVKADGFEYNGAVYKSLSAVAGAVTGGRWNGWAFFGLKRNKTK